VEDVYLFDVDERRMMRMRMMRRRMMKRRNLIILYLIIRENLTVNNNFDKKIY
jgi:hypothetical protein